MRCAEQRAARQWEDASSRAGGGEGGAGGAGAEASSGGAAGGAAENLSSLNASAGEAASPGMMFGASPVLAPGLDDSVASSVQPGSADSSMWASVSGVSAAPAASLSHSFSLLVEGSSPGGGAAHSPALGIFAVDASASAARAGADADGAAARDRDVPAAPESSESGAAVAGAAVSLTANSVPRTGEELKSRMDALLEKLSARPLSYAMIEDVSRQVKILLDGRKALKSRRHPIRKGDMVFASGDGEESFAHRRGVIEADNGDGSYTVKWLSPVQETARVEAHEVKPASRYQGGAGGPHQAHHQVNRYLVQRAIPDKNASMVEELLREGADADNVDDTGTPALLQAIMKRCPHQIVTALLKHGADPDLPGPPPTMQTPLRAAIANNDFEVVTTLLHNGCDCTKIDEGTLAACAPRVAAAIQQHAATALSDEVRVALQHEGMAKLVPLVVAACGLESDIKPQLSALNLLMYLMDQLPAAVLQQVFLTCDTTPAGASLAGGRPQHASTEQQATDSLFNVMLQLTQGEGCDALDAIYGLLRIVQCLIEKSPHHVARLRRSGMIRWVERLSNAAQTKQDVQAKLLQSKTGRIKDKHVSKLASDVLAILPQASPQDLCATPELRQACEDLRQRQPTAFQSLADVLTRAQETSPHDLAVCDVAGAILEALNGPKDQPQWNPVQWNAFVAAFCPSREDESALAADGGSAQAGLSRRSKLDCLIAPLVELIGTEEFWPIHASGDSRRADGSILPPDELQVLTAPIRLELSPRLYPSKEGAKVARGSSSLAPPLVLNVEPLLRVEELERHLLRTCTPPQEYVAFCHYLVNATIKERPSCNSAAPLRLAVVVGFDMQPQDTTKEAEDPGASGGDVSMQGGADLELDIRTRAPCLTVNVEGSTTVVACQSKGSPAGTVQASRPFSSSVDGPIAYFEAAIRKRGPTGAIGVGLARAGYSNNKMPGWEPVSHAWHGDDGCTFNSCGTGTPLSTPWQEGDVIGCGIDFCHAAIFFTRNGLQQPGALRGVDTEGLLATLGFQTKGECVSVSFGPHFLYDLSSHDLAPPLRNEKEEIERDMLELRRELAYELVRSSLNLISTHVCVCAHACFRS